MNPPLASSSAGDFASLTIASQGLELLGGTVTEDLDFAESIARKRVQKCMSSIDAVMELKDPQLCLTLLRSCLGMVKLGYCWRTTPAAALVIPSQLLSQALVEALRWIVVADGPNFNDFHFRLATLPTRFGGLGVTQPNDALAYSYSCIYNSFQFFFR